MSSIPETPSGNSPKPRTKPRSKRVGQMSTIKTKWCPRCQRERPINEFHRCKTSRDGRVGHCRNCVSAYGAEYRKRNPADRFYHVHRNYGLTQEQYNEMLNAQGGRCAICGSSDHGSKNWHVDHDHETGVVRGILCQGCNHALGGVKDNPDTGIALAKYLWKHGK